MTQRHAHSSHPCLPQVDAASGLLLLGVLILLCKDPASAVRMGHPLPMLVAAILALPVLALVPGTLRAWWVPPGRLREPLHDL